MAGKSVCLCGRYFSLGDTSNRNGQKPQLNPFKNLVVIKRKKIKPFSDSEEIESPSQAGKRHMAKMSAMVGSEVDWCIKPEKSIDACEGKCNCYICCVDTGTEDKADWRYKVPHYRTQHSQRASKTKKDVCKEAADDAVRIMVDEDSPLYANSERRKTQLARFPFTRSYCAFDNRQAFGEAAVHGKPCNQDKECDPPDYENDWSHLQK